MFLNNCMKGLGMVERRVAAFRATRDTSQLEAVDRKLHLSRRLLENTRDLLLAFAYLDEEPGKCHI